MDDELDRLERSMGRRKYYARALYAVVIAVPLVIVGKCVRELVRTPPQTTVALTDEDKSVIRGIAREHARAIGQQPELVAPAAILDALRSPHAEAGACATQLATRRIAEGYQPPPFPWMAITPAELAAAKPSPVPLATDEAFEIILVVARRREPHANLAGTEFDPGEVAGRAFLWDHRANAITCAGDIAAHSSDSVRTTQTTIGGVVNGAASAANGYLQQDLDLETERAIATSLRAVR